MTGIMKHVDTNVPRMLLGALVGHCTGGAYFWPRFGLSWPAGAEFGKMTYTIVFVNVK